MKKLGLFTVFAATLITAVALPILNKTTFVKPLLNSAIQKSISIQ